ncbi:MAG TPA: TlpA disulfide reductase family protein [Sphingomicrobium sp.]|nr:TlpA disulfide reductase family protein [Sphingomicrobium sp.]
MRLIVLLLIGLLGLGCDRQNPGREQATGSTRPAKGVDRSHKGETAPATLFEDPDGADFSLAGLKGSPVLLNLWASWCAPCVKELPTLDQLAVEQDGKLAVIAVSQDMAPQSSVTAFLKQHGVGNLDAYHDPEMGLTSALGVQIMPTTVLYDSVGKEVWRFAGDLDWTSPEASKLLSEASPATAH